MVGVFTMRLHNVLLYVDDIGLSDYPIFDEQHREVLNNKIIEHYRYHEIGLETVEMFVWSMRRKMNEIMPLYNKLYESELLKFDPFNTQTYSEIVDNLANTVNTSNESSTTNNVSEALSEARTVNSETPQVALSGREDYATSLSDSKSKSEGTADVSTLGETSATTNSDGKMTRKVEGSTGSRSDLLMQFRDSFLNVDLMVVGELAPLFMQLWNAGDSYSDGHSKDRFGGFEYGTFGL